ncbi:CBS domain-containing protein [Actinobaculum suis]|uniref:CBS domain-containing protein n=1 Tax=Actinobaculum suis TaxID=1657 RepID=A0A0K9EUG1_9ACTO|nr:CBS domain-containing protein [Actinobaculum suis]KMY23482.1 magnesium transporter [Actinobaculum suis]MDY5153359.1 CBS domain-containing protein [Actinobaculum suis]OCA95991.1 magnesium transporter [Actinobaculum suis]OCA96219.1 magnesium transporter [Actinobaculum suis]SDE48945.1 CBS domain-containing protein [Actinobaculum suis]
MATSTRVFVGRLAGTSVFDLAGDAVGKVADVVVVFRLRGAPSAVGLLVDVAGRRRVFLPLTRVTAIANGQVLTTGVLNIRRFQQRPMETLVIAQLLDREVVLKATGERVSVVDIAIERTKLREWELTELYVRGTGSASRKSQIVKVSEVEGLASPARSQGASTIVAQISDMRPADVADILRDLPVDRMQAVARELTDERLADILEELGTEDRATVLAGLDVARAGDVLDAMQPDDAADLVADLPTDTAAVLLESMSDQEAEDVRRLLRYDERTAGGLMTPNPIILGPDASVAQALASASRADIPPALAAIVFVCRPPLETPTGRYLGAVHLQRALREPPATLLGSILDTNVVGLEPEASIEDVTRELATYNMTAIPVTDAGSLLGAVSVDDVLDHLLPEDWRERDNEEEGSDVH